MSNVAKPLIEADILLSDFGVFVVGVGLALG